ncbi:MAG: hypothetical protein JOZ15_17840, partial [Acidobacteria bacterium]|nr:hypothetical protein [Acidobacteriota bacterium]
MPEQMQGFRLSPQQARLWAFAEEGPGFGAQAAIELAGELDLAALGRALAAVASRHEMLRTSFHRTAGVRLPVQASASCELRLRELDLTGAPAAGQPDRVQAARERELAAAGGSAGPLRAALLTLAAGRRLLLLTLPGQCADAASLCNLFRELAAELRGERGAAPDEVVQYAQFAEWQHELLADPETEEGKDFWRRQEPPAAALPFCAPAASGTRFAPARHTAVVAAAAAAALDELARRLGVAGELVLLGAWIAFLRRVTATAEVVVGRGVAGRSLAELTGAVGLFARWLPVRCRLAPQASLLEAVAQIAPAAAAAETWQDSFLAADAGWAARRLDLGFDCVELPAAERAGALSLTLGEVTACCEPFAVRLCCVRRGAALALELHHDGARLGAGYARCLLGQLLAFVHAVAARPAAGLDEPDLLDGAFRERLVVRFN